MILSSFLCLVNLRIVGKFYQTPGVHDAFIVSVMAVPILNTLTVHANTIN